MINLTYIRLKYFTFLPICFGKDEIIINREDSPNIIILIQGENGSGKSSLMQELTPFPLEHTISRTSKRTEKDKIGEKELHFVVSNRMKYVCKIYYGVNKTSAYLYEEDVTDPNSGVELNQNGNISTYEELLETKLGISKNKQRMIYLSADLVNFVNMKSADRSKYLSYFLPDISLFLKGFDIVSKKSNEKKKEIDNVNRELGKLNSINYENNLKELKLKIENIYQNLDKIKQDITKFNVFQENLNKYSNIFNQKEKIRQLFFKYGNELDILKNKIVMEMGLINKYNVKNGEKQLNEDILNLEKNLIKEKENEYNFEKEIDKLHFSIKEKEVSLSNDSVKNENINDILYFIDSYNKDLDKYNTEIEILSKNNEYLIKIFENMTIDKIYDFSRLMDLIIDNSNNIDNDDFNINDLSNKVLNIEKEIELLNLNNNTIKNDIEELNNSISLIKSNEEMKKLYELRGSCSKNACDIIKELEKYINIDNEKHLMIKNKDLLEEKLDLNNKRKEILNSSLFEIQENVKIITNINKIIIENTENITYFSDDLKEIFKNENLYFIIKELRNIKILFNDFREYIHLKEKIQSLNNNLNELKIKKNNIILSNNLEKEVKELELLQEKKSTSSSNINILEEELKELKNLSIIKTKIDNDINKYNLMREELIDVKNRLINLANIEYYSNLIKDICFKLEINKNIKEKELKELEDERELLKSEYINKTVLEKLRNELLEVKKKYDVLKSIWSIREGYPALLLNNFLINLKNDVNDNLREIWDDSLYIEDFVLSQTEFSIIINRDGVIVQDASQCSSGEKSILTLAISLSIIEMSLKEKQYDILRLDELDSNLDKIRSSRYLDLLKERLERMNVSSCFIITHKSDYDAIPADIILLKGSSGGYTLENKNIIFDVENC